MPDSEILKMVNLLKKFRGDIISIEEERSNALRFKEASKDLQSIYALHLNNKMKFNEVEHYLKNLYASFNYAAVIMNDALKRESLKPENIVHLDEALEIMLKCCDLITAKLKKKK